MSYPLGDPVDAGDDLGIEAPAWLFVLSWDLKHAGGVNEVVKNVLTGRRAACATAPCSSCVNGSKRRPS